MKMTKTFSAICLFAVTTLSTMTASAVTLAVPLISQEKTQWCWIGVSNMVMKFVDPAYATTQTTVANWAVAGHNVPNYFSYDANRTESIGGTNVTFHCRGISQVLKNFGNLENTVYSRTLTVDELQEEIDGDRPVIILLGWYSAHPTGTRRGGHFVVISGFDGTTVDINDPWPTNGGFSILRSSLLAGPSGTYRPTSGPHKWEWSLTIANSLDIVFLFDSTGSMGDDIANVKTNVNTIIDNLTTKFKDYRIAVADYKDYPQSPWGSASDYVFQGRTAFAKGNAAAAKTAINALSTGGGNDWPESVYSAVKKCLDGNSIGAWRGKPTKRKIVVLGDAPGHDPEPFPGGTTSTAVLAHARDPNLPIQIHTLLVGSDLDARASFDLISGGTGGSSWEAASASDVDDGLNSIVDEVSENPRFPRGDVANFLPAFTFETPGIGMGAVATSTSLEIMSFDSATWFWKPYKKIVLPKGANSYVSTTPLPLGRFQWRLITTQPASTILLPDGTTTTSRGGIFYEDAFTEFNRILAPPGEPSGLSPNAGGFTTTSATVTYSWNKPAGIVTSYVLRIYQAGTLWRTVTVAEPKATVTDARTYKLAGHKITGGVTYRWEIQALNFDRPKVLNNAWTP